MKAKKALSIFLLIVTLLVLAFEGYIFLGGGLAQKTPQAAASTAAPAPEITPDGSLVSIGDAEINSDAGALDLSGSSFTADELCAAAGKLGSVRKIELGNTALDSGELERVKAAFPDVELTYTVTIAGEDYKNDTESIDLSKLAPAEVDEAAETIMKLPEVLEVNLIDNKGDCAWTADDISILRQARPELKVKCCFELFGQKISSEDESIVYDEVEIGEEGLAQIRAVLPYLNCSRFQISDCGISDETLAQLRDDFPERNIVWIVRLFNDEYMTDCERIVTIHINDQVSSVLKYCTQVKYVDFGHNDYISDISFLAYMPKLEVAIIAITQVTDLTPLASCPELEYLEVFNTRISDISPLASCTKLQHINLAHCEKLKDISPLYGLTELKRVRILCTPIPQAQKDELKKLVPDCDIQDQGWESVAEGWRYDENGTILERYALLREQMGYK